MPLFPLKPLPPLKGKAAKDFLKEMARVDAGISDAEKKKIQDRLWKALRFFSGKDLNKIPPPV